MSYQPYIPIPLLFQGNSVSVTGTLTETTLASFTIKAGMMGLNDYIEAFTSWSFTSNATSRTLNFKIGSSNYYSLVQTTSVTEIRHIEIHSRNSLASQICFTPTSQSDNGTNTAAIGTFTEDFSTDKLLAITGTLGNTGHTISLESCSVILWKQPIQ